jgi:hypothetical protein
MGHFHPLEGLQPFWLKPFWLKCSSLFMAQVLKIVLTQSTSRNNGGNDSREASAEEKGDISFT